MNTFRLIPLLALALLATSQAALDKVARGDYSNLASASTTIQGKNPGVTIIQGNISTVANAPTGGGRKLLESSFGQPVAQWLPDDAWVRSVETSVRALLYPPANQTRSQVESGGTAFRYKMLLFSPAGAETDVTNHFDSMDTWFGTTERNTVNNQITAVREAIAHAPLDSGLRHLLLDIYYDLAVAEMQFAKKKQAELATMRLGFVLTGPFIIDQEITKYQELVTLVEAVLEKYKELLSTTADGVEPSDFDPDPVVKNMPYGYYMFIREQANRNNTASQYADASGTQTVPDVGIDPDGNGPTLPPVVSRPANQVLFSGYKDYTTLFTVMGRYIQFQADLARLRGMRQGSGDLNAARSAMTRMNRDLARDFRLLRGMFPNATFLPGDASGVDAAISAVETALADVTNVRGFLNGKTNLLGLDPEFLLLVQDPNPPSGQPRESFDVLRERLLGANQPLTVALTLMTDAETRYTNFRASVDKVTQEMADIEDAFAERFLEITGYTPTESPGFRGFAKPSVGSELLTAEQTIASLQARSTVLKDLSTSLETDYAEATKSVTVANQLKQTLENATETYKADTKRAYLSAKIASGIAAASQAVTDATLTVLSLDPGNAIFSGGGTAIAIGAAGAANAIAQGTAAVAEIETQQALDYAALEFETALDRADAELVVNQTKQEVGAIKREQYAHKLEAEDNRAALAQAQAQRTALLNEARRIQENRDSNTVAVRSKYYADPIHYLRAESALIDADESFRRAQRWVFYTQRALEYKWQQRFSITQGSKSYDSGAIFKLRNAKELDALLTQLVAWNDARVLEDNRSSATTFISLLDDVVAPNPNKLNLTLANQTDPRIRVDPKTGQSVTQVELFRRRLRDYTDTSGFIRIPFSTVLLEDHNGNFFRGADYLANGTIVPGLWRDKIVYVKVNIIATDGVAIPQVKNGGLIYAGNTMQRTRVPLCSNRARPLANFLNGVADIGGEFTVAPFRFWVSPTYNDNFVYQNSQNVSISLAYTNATARSITGEEILASTFEIKSFHQRSVAATGWELVINPSQVDINKLKDIEVIIRHTYSDRIQPNGCP